MQYVQMNNIYATLMIAILGTAFLASIVGKNTAQDKPVGFLGAIAYIAYALCMFTIFMCAVLLLLAGVVWMALVAFALLAFFGWFTIYEKQQHTA